MLHVINKVHACWDGKYRERHVTSHIVIHRIEPEIGNYAEDFAEEFKKTGKYEAGSYTGGQMPYHFLCFKDGRCEQALAIMDTGPHALVWSQRAIAVAMVGDFHLNDTPTAEQWATTVNLCAVLGWWMGAYQLRGHTELPNASKDPKKRCPGSGVSLDDLRAAVAIRIKDITPEYDRLAKDLVLGGRDIVGSRRSGYGIVIDIVGA